MSASSSSSKPAPAPARKIGGNYVVVHDMVSNFGWVRNHVVLADEEHPVSDDEVKRLTKLGAIRDATADEVKAAVEAQKAAEEAGEEFTGYSIPEPPPETEVQTSARVG
jgi:hypothetical protein